MTYLESKALGLMALAAGVELDKEVQLGGGRFTLVTVALALMTKELQPSLRD
jgi:hypothetical protein